MLIFAKVLQELGGQRVGKGAVEIPEGVWSELRTFLDRWKVKYEGEKVWCS